MIKSFQTSGGTVLSTDWNDIKKKDFEGEDKVECVWHHTVYTTTVLGGGVQ